jgi:hypothetical protein
VAEAATGSALDGAGTSPHDMTGSMAECDAPAVDDVGPEEPGATGIPAAGVGAAVHGSVDEAAGEGSAVDATGHGVNESGDGGASGAEETGATSPYGC